ncbi:hypothetical protein [Haloechinothrix alba]|uniref:hypothetical protein n=1 Tax=Haloechinothrix alba TaxID=664784 RepID=UPI001C3E6AD3
MLGQLPFEQASPLEVPPLLRRLQFTGPVHRIRTRVGDEAWLVTGYEHVRLLLDDARLGRSHPDPGNAARSAASAIFGGPLGCYETEQADHARSARCCNRSSRHGVCGISAHVWRRRPPRCWTTWRDRVRRWTWSRSWRTRCRSW